MISIPESLFIVFENICEINDDKFRSFTSNLISDFCIKTITEWSNDPDSPVYQYWLHTDHFESPVDDELIQSVCNSKSYSRSS
jgi:hypothetical protein